MSRAKIVFQDANRDGKNYSAPLTTSRIGKSYRLMPNLLYIFGD